jgi:hypothetical protein
VALDEATGLLACQARRFSVDEYHQMIDAHILGEDDRVELLEGLIVTVSPQKPPHAVVTERLNDVLFLGLGREFLVRCQLPLTLPESESEPEPDITVIPRGSPTHQEHPHTAPLVFEVSRASLRRDRLVKARIYARASVLEYALVDVAGRRIEVHREPLPAERRYAQAELLAMGDRFVSRSVPGVSFALADLFAGLD